MKHAKGNGEHRIVMQSRAVEILISNGFRDSMCVSVCFFPSKCTCRDSVRRAGGNEQRFQNVQVGPTNAGKRDEDQDEKGASQVEH